MENNNIYRELLMVALPGYDWNTFDVVKIEVKHNEDKNTNRIYLETVYVTIEEKNIFPNHLWSPEDWYAHGFCPSKTYSDQSLRCRLVVITERMRRWRHKETKQIGTSNVESPLLPWTKAPTDLLYFLK